MNMSMLIDRLVATEKEAEDLYGLIAHQTKGEFRRIAHKFSKQEESHGQVIASLVDEPEKDLVLDERLVLLLESTLGGKDQGKKGLAIANEKELFTLAMQIEKESIVLYGEIAGSLPEGCRARALFEKLVKEEKNHLYTVLRVLQDLE